jgi:hypothetical protein
VDAQILKKTVVYFKSRIFLFSICDNNEKNTKIDQNELKTEYNNQLLKIIIKYE